MGYKMWIYSSKFLHCAVLGLLVLFVFGFGVEGGFYFDDQPNITNNLNVQIVSLDAQSLYQSATSGTAGPTGRPVAMLSFGLNHVFSGLDASDYKLTNIVLHCFCALAVYFLSTLLLKRVSSIPSARVPILSFCVAALWAVHPVNLSPVLYVVQRMTILSGLFVMLAMCCYCKGRELLSSGAAVKALIAFGVSYCVFLPLAVFSKENGLLVLVYLFLIEVFFYRFKDDQGQTLKLLKQGHQVVAFVFIILGLIWFYSILKGYDLRDFTLQERLMTEARVLFFYLGQIILPNISSLGIHHDGFSISRSLFTPVSTFISIVGIAVCFMFSLIQRTKLPLICFAILFYFAAHAMESTIIGLELVHEHRNYVASFGVVMLLVVGAMVVWGAAETSFRRPLIILFCTYGLWVVGSATARSIAWSNPLQHAFYELENHPQSPRANYRVGRLFAQSISSSIDRETRIEAVRKATELFEKTVDLSDSYTDGLFGLLLIEVAEGEAMRPEMFSQLLFRLEFKPFHHNSYNYLHSLALCFEKGDCTWTQEKQQRLIAAFSSNKGFRGKRSRDLLERYERIAPGV
jgi:protein O-mannosyl-transferase